MFMPVVKRILPTSAQPAGETPSELATEQYTIGNNNRWSRIVLNFQDLDEDVWCELTFQIKWHSEEESRNVHDFAAVGIDFLTEDGSRIDFAYVPGLTRTQIDPHSYYITGPDYHRLSGEPPHSYHVRCTFLVPSPARKIQLSIRSWRNSHPFTITQPVLRQFDHSSRSSDIEEQQYPSQGSTSVLSQGSRHHWRNLTSKPVWFSYALIPNRRLLIRGQVVNRDMGSDGALVRVVFHDAQGEELSPPYPETVLAPTIGAFINIPTHSQTRRFTLELVPPPQAAAVDLGFQAWRDENPVELVTPLEVSLEEDLLLENISGEESPDALNFLKRVIERILPSLETGASQAGLDPLASFVDQEALASPLVIHDRLKFVQHGNKNEKIASGKVTIGAFPGWSLPQELSWTEDPFQSPAWRLEFQSLSWLLAITRDQKSGGLARALDLALSWSQSNPLGNPADVISAHPRSMAIRAEVFLQLLSLGLKQERKAISEKLLVLFAEVTRHCFALSQIVSQNVFSYSIHELHAACSLLVLARAIPRIPLAPYWSSIALAHLRDGFDKLIGLDGSSIEQSQHYRLEILSLGLILAAQLEEVSGLDEFRQQLLARVKAGIRVAIGLIDPTGHLPPFGDMPFGYHHASWLRRLVVDYCQSLMSDEEILAELSYPEGPRVLISPDAGLIAARRYNRKPDWGYFCTSFNEQRHEHGHFDCTSFVYASGGLKWIADPGGAGWSDIGPARQYLISSRAHNIAIPDGREQMAGRGWIQSQFSLEHAHVFEIGSNVYGADYFHRRVMICLEDINALAIFDHFMTAGRSTSFEGFLHFEPEVTAAIVNPKLAVGFQGRGRLRIIPRVISGTFGGVAIQSGYSSKPSLIQGFVSRRPSLLEPANVLSYTFSGQHTVCGGVILAADDRSLKDISDILDAPSIKNLLAQTPSEDRQE